MHSPTTVHTGKRLRLARRWESFIRKLCTGGLTLRWFGSSRASAKRAIICRSEADPCWLRTTLNQAGPSRPAPSRCGSKFQELFGLRVPRAKTRLCLFTQRLSIRPAFQDCSQGKISYVFRNPSALGEKSGSGFGKKPQPKEEPPLQQRGSLGFRELKECYGKFLQPD